MSTANAFEREMLDLINQERTSRGLNPLQLETSLNESSEDHSTWMLNTDTFSHTGSGGSSATNRMESAGFDLSGSWRTGENIAWQSERGDPGISDDVAQLHDNLMNSPGHRANILNPDFEYIGIGIESGDMQGFDAVMVTQNFASTDGSVVLDDGAAPQTPVTPDDVIADPVDPDIPDIDAPDTDVTDTPATDTPDTDAPDSDVTDTDEPVSDNPDIEIVEEGIPSWCFDLTAFLDEIATFVEDLQSQLDQFTWNNDFMPDADATMDEFDISLASNNDPADINPATPDDMPEIGTCDMFTFNYFDMNCMADAA